MSQYPADNPTAALYIHIPFCEKRCSYCDFYTVANRKSAIPAYMQAVLREMALRAEAAPWPQQRFATLYFGGGTPSLLTPAQIAQLIEAARQHFAFVADTEITLEANPGTVQPETLRGYRDAGVNRLSLGVQSFWPDELAMLERLHSVEDIGRTVADARAAGFANLSIDLMFAFPGQRPSRWRHTLERTLALAPEHISAYNLTIEAGTPLAKQIQAGQVRPLTESRQRAFFKFSIDFLEAHGYRHYEVSNYARPGFESRHNRKYWDGSLYLSLGASAHSYDGRRRFWNVANYVHYTNSLEAGHLPIASEEMLSPEKQRFEMVFLGLRQRQGVDVQRFSERFYLDFREHYRIQLDRLLQHTPPLLEFSDRHLRLTPEGWLLCDAVCAEFVE